MTTAEIEAFVGRLQRRELGATELSALTTRDLDDINAYLAARLSARNGPPRSRSNGPREGARRASGPPRSREYSEAEILAELID
jgi:hypothetical protein